MKQQVAGIYGGKVSIDHGSGVAPWRQIYAALRGRIDSGELAPGDRVSSITSLSQEYQVALTTVRKAMDRLKEDGLVITSPMGTFVRRPGSPQNPL
jgi:GntR family transcriptional regulator